MLGGDYNVILFHILGPSIGSLDEIAHTAELFGLDVEQVKGRSRTRNLVHARQVAMYVCRELTDLSYPQIGREFGDRDHTTVIHAYEKVANLMQEKQETYDDVTALIQTLLAER